MILKSHVNGLQIPINTRAANILRENTRMSKRTTMIQRVSLIPIGEKEQTDKAYKYISDSIYAFYKTNNQIMGEIYSAFYNNGCNLNLEEYKAEHSELFSYDNPAISKIEYPGGIDILELSIKKVESDFKKALLNGLAQGKITAKNYKRTEPLPVSKETLNFDIKFENLKNGTPNIRSLSATLNWVNGISFEVYFEKSGYGFNTQNSFYKIHTGEYTIEDSKIIIEKNKRGIRGINLYLSLNVPGKVHTLNEDTVIGVNLGLSRTIVCCLNTDNYKRLYLEPDLLIKSTEQRIYSAEKDVKKLSLSTRTEHKRQAKEQFVNRLKHCKESLIKRINDKATTNILLFAQKNNAKYINIENMAWYGAPQKNSLLVRNGNYADFEEQLIRKSHKFGMIVRKINPYSTMHTCSFCGCQEDGQLISDTRFLCKNPDCVSHTFKGKGEANKKYIEPDFNAARNIAKSTEFKKSH